MSQLAYSIFEFNDYRVFLRRTFDHEKTSKGKATLSTFAKKIGLSTSGFQMILEGNRNLSFQKIISIGKSLRLTIAELEYFEALVLLASSDDSQQRSFYEKRIQKFKKLTRKKRVKITRFSDRHFLSRWYTPALLVYWLDNKNPDIQQLSSDLGVTQEEIAQSFSGFETSGLVNKDENGNIHLQFSSTVSDKAQIRFLLEMIDVIRSKVEKKFSSPDFYIDSHAFSFPFDQFENLKIEQKKLIEKFITTGEKKENLITIQAINCYFKLIDNRSPQTL